MENRHASEKLAAKLDCFLETTFDLATENTELVGKLVHQHTLLTEQESEMEDLTDQLDKSTLFAQELAALNLRSEFFEAQLSLLEAHTAVNFARGPDAYNDWKDRSLNWRTTETTLDNLELEYRYLMNQYKQYGNFKNTGGSQKCELDRDSDVHHESSYANTSVDSVFSVDVSTNTENTTHDVQMRPIRCKGGLNSISSALPQGAIQALPNQGILLPPFDGASTPAKEIKPQHLKKYASLSHLNKTTGNRKRFESFFPDDFSTSFEVTFDEDDCDYDRPPNRDHNTAETSINAHQTPLRHFLSYDTALSQKQTLNLTLEDLKFSRKTVASSPDSQVSLIKDSQDDFDNPSEPEDYGEDAKTFDVHQEILPEKCPLKRSASYESVFQKGFQKDFPTPREPVLDLKKQTIKWLDIFHTPVSGLAAQNTVNATIKSRETAFPFTPTSSATTTATTITNHQTSKELLSSVVGSSHSKTSSGIFPFFSHPSTPEITQRIESETDTGPSSNPPEASSPAIPIPHSRDSRSSVHSMRRPSLASRGSFMTSQQYSQWSMLFAKLNPQSIIPGSAYSEVGKPIHGPSLRATPTVHHDSHFKGVKRFEDTPSTFNGSHSTITIGPNHSKIVRHGLSSDLHKHVVASRVSYAALRDALDSDLA
ncbi:unnamed protein product [Kuraishia capsulata CBS 1993]|uniref:Uncharacterized protein n=1 Tax=Kuraishia capsulata CBS 1993 TaxID=1382522 RepID=W6MK30_9ASCO|nr:uncharacterized protein KUCA_T00002874001 [Kuraishia capsulata CBS 1993]CDK26899.1 unnamed protein product [Kuraishia capsulata CBS 1993]